MVIAETGVKEYVRCFLRPDDIAIILLGYLLIEPELFGNESRPEIGKRYFQFHAVAL